MKYDFPQKNHSTFYQKLETFEHTLHSSRTTFVYPLIQIKRTQEMSLVMAGHLPKPPKPNSTHSTSKRSQQWAQVMATLVVPWDCKTGRVPDFTYESFTQRMCQYRNSDNLRHRRIYWYVNSLSTNLRVCSKKKTMLNKWRYEHAEEVPELFTRAKKKHAKEEAALSVDAHQLATELMISNDVGRPKTAREARQELHMDNLKATFKNLYSTTTSRGSTPFTKTDFRKWPKIYHEHWANTTAKDIQTMKGKIRVPTQSNTIALQTPVAVVEKLRKQYNLDSTQHEFLSFVTSRSTSPTPSQFLVLLHGPCNVLMLYVPFLNILLTVFFWRAISYTRRCYIHRHFIYNFYNNRPCNYKIIAFTRSWQNASH